MMLWVWGGIFVAAVGVELLSQQLLSIWFAVGAAAALVGTLLGLPFWGQLVVFVAVSALLLLLTRPIVRRIYTFPSKDTNLRQDLGKIGIVVQQVEPVKGTGRVRVDDIDWIAISQNGEVIPVGTTVRVEAMEGTKLFVVPVVQPEPMMSV